MSRNKVGWCRITQELVLDVEILKIPYLRDDMDVYANEGNEWAHWSPEQQKYRYTTQEEVPEVVQVAMMMLS